MTHRGCSICRVVERTEPCQSIYEDDRVLAFLDPAPVNPGHALLVPKRHVGGLSALPTDELAHLMLLGPLLAQAIARALDYDGYNLHAASGECAGAFGTHAVLHLIPRIGTDAFHWNWRRVSYDDAQAAQMLAAIQERLTRHPLPTAADGPR